MSVDVVRWLPGDDIRALVGSVHELDRFGISFVRWPADDAQLGLLRAAGAPRLVLLDSAEQPPPMTDCLEDWIWLPSAVGEVEARLAALQVRLADHRRGPVLDERGRFSHRGHQVQLSAQEASLCRALLDRFGQVVTDRELTDRGWPDEEPSPRLLAFALGPIRRASWELGLELVRVPRRGYLLRMRRPWQSPKASGGPEIHRPG